MKLESTGNVVFDQLAKALDQRLDQECLNVADLERDLLQVASADDCKVSDAEKVVIDQLKGKAAAQLPFADGPPPVKAAPVKAKGDPHAVDNFYTFFLNYSQLPQGKALGLRPAYELKAGEALGSGVIVETHGLPHLTKEKSDQLAQQLGFKDAGDLQKKVGAPIDGYIGPSTLAKLNPYLEKHGLFTVK